MWDGRFVLVVVVLGVLTVVAFLALTLGAGISVEVDDDGFFSSADRAPEITVFPGTGVILATIDRTHGRLVGRVEPRADAPAIWTRSAAGELTHVALRTTAAKTGLSGSVRAAALASLRPSGEPSTMAAFAESCGAAAASSPAPRTDAALPMTSRSPVAPAASGEPLESWAPEECLFVRFRSVEAGYRFASAFDSLAAALMASQMDDARDYGSLRLALHDLVLPTIWRTNPGVERGVGEVALVVAAPFVRGRLSAAVLMRITDPELHRMQTEAGLAQERAPDHLWRPANDPFPAERDPINFRAIPAGAPDIEVVATTRALGERIVSRKFAPIGRSTRFREARAPTAGADGLASTDEAVFAFSAIAGDPAWRDFVPGILRSAGREMREGSGVRWLAERWLGSARATTQLDERSHAAAAFASIEAVRVTTDPVGAAIRVRCTDANAAARFAAALRELPAAGASADRACLRNLADLVPVSLVENPQDDLAERNFVVLGWKPVCPCAGTYSAHPVTREVSCSLHGTAASPRTARFTPPAISEVKPEGAELSFRLAIDWNRNE